MSCNKRKKNLNILFDLALTVALIACATYGAFAWFFLRKVSETGDLEIDIPPIIYIKDDNLREMTSFELDGLQINREYASVFCVSPVFENAVSSFDLGVIYTENIGMVIDIYPVENISFASSNGSSEIEKSLANGRNCYFTYSIDEGSLENWHGNKVEKKVTYGGWENTDPAYRQEDLTRGVYKYYTGFRFYDSETDGETDETLKEMKNTQRYVFFVLKVTWKDNLVEEELAKEVDIVYIVSNGLTTEGGRQ